jgi:hypothetical protein
VQVVANRSGGKLKAMRREHGQRKATLAHEPAEFRTPDALAYAAYILDLERAEHRRSGRLGRNRARGGSAPTYLGPEHDRKHAVLAGLMHKHPLRSNAWLSGQLAVLGFQMSPQAIGKHKKPKPNKPR